ncbi:MAG: PAS domain S-box protein [Betaproteobacteria bacterium]|nr:PAS domain S-box protein [Betaproteobacteria bacterium]
MNARGESLALLFVEESPEDCSLVVGSLEREGIAVYSRRVDTPEGFRAALREASWDAIVSDCHTAGFGAERALDMLRESGLDIPLVVVAGLVGEEKAIDLMRRGASDFVPKDRLARLAPALKREVGDARDRVETRLTRARLAETLERHAAAIDSATDGYATVGDDRCFIEVNDALCALAGRRRESLLGRPFLDILENREAVQGALPACAIGAAGQSRLETCIARPDGTQVDIELTLTCRGEGKPEIFLFAHDITARKRHEAELAESNRDGERVRQVLLSVLEDQKEIADELRASEERFRGMLEYNVAAMFMIEDGNVTYANARTGQILGHHDSELLGRPILAFVAPEDHAGIASAVEELTSGRVARAERTFRAIRKDGTFVDMGATASRVMLRGRPVILGTAQDIGERKRAQAEIDRYIAQLEESMTSTLEAVSNLVELRDPYTSGHERRVGDLAAAIGRRMGLAEGVVKGLRLTGYVHDIGKISVPAELLTKPLRLTKTEFELIKAHARAGHDVLKDVNFPWPVAEVILQHHERLDGSGYPRGLKGEEIILEARIISVADVVEAMASHRPYRAGLGIERALEELEAGAGTLYDAEVAGHCLALFREEGFSLGD